MSLSQSQYSVAESDIPSPAIMLSNRASEDVVVEVTLSDGSANGNVQYQCCHDIIMILHS